MYTTFHFVRLAQESTGPSQLDAGVAIENQTLPLCHRQNGTTTARRRRRRRNHPQQQPPKQQQQHHRNHRPSVHTDTGSVCLQAARSAATVVQQQQQNASLSGASVSAKALQQLLLSQSMGRGTIPGAQPSVARRRITPAGHNAAIAAQVAGDAQETRCSLCGANNGTAAHGAFVGRRIAIVAVQQQQRTDAPSRTPPRCETFSRQSGKQIYGKRRRQRFRYHLHASVSLRNDASLCRTQINDHRHRITGLRVLGSH